MPNNQAPSRRSLWARIRRTARRIPWTMLVLLVRLVWWSIIELIHHHDPF